MGQLEGSFEHQPRMFKSDKNTITYTKMNRRLFIDQLPRKWHWYPDIKCVVISWEDGESYAFAIPNPEFMSVIDGIPQLFGMSLDKELQQQKIPIKLIKQLTINHINKNFEEGNFGDLFGEME